MAEAPQSQQVRWEQLADRVHRCPCCLHFWVSHGVPGEDGYGCSFVINPMAERERGVVTFCACTFSEGNPVTPDWVRHEPLELPRL